MPELVGQVCTVLLWYPTILLRCNCTPAGSTLVLIGINQVGACPTCKRNYVNQGMGPDGNPILSHAVSTAGGGN